MTHRPHGLEHDWFGRPLPPNIRLASDVHIDSTYGFDAFISERPDALTMARASGAYGLTSLHIGPRGRVRIGAFTCLNSPCLICNDRITIGAHCLIGWGTVITDTDASTGWSVEAHRRSLEAAAADPDRLAPPPSPPRPVVIEDKVWIGFGSVIEPGVVIGEGSIVACRTVVTEDVPPYSVVAGSPARVVRRLSPEAAKRAS